MTLSRDLLARYLRQIAELGIGEVVLDDMTAEEALALLARRGTPGGGATAAAPEASSDQTRPGEPAQPAAGSGRSRAAAAFAATADRADSPAPPRSKAERGRSAAPPSAEVPAATEALQDPVAANPAVASPVVQNPAMVAGTNAATAPDRLATLATVAAGCLLCRLHESRTTVVFGEGSPAADVVVVGEAPGQEEDRTGRPFVGRAGKLLDLLLMTAGFPRESVYICNVLKCRPPNNRNPMADEVAACTSSYLHGQLESIAPKVLLAVGKFAAQALLSSEESIGRMRGAVHTYRGTPLVVTYHPAYLLRSPQMTRVAWQDFQLLRKVLHEQARG